MEIRKNKRQRKKFIKQEIASIKSQSFLDGYDEARLYLLEQECQKTK